jgi:crotonobetainyl-CoA:carnitine CoA-transferase CaiB-like acyl-CoA transferase
MEQTSFGALHGVKVIDLSRILGGPYCGQILGDHGADVLKVEPPQGDDTRTWGSAGSARTVRLADCPVMMLQSRQ